MIANAPANMQWSQLSYHIFASVNVIFSKSFVLKSDRQNYKLSSPEFGYTIDIKKTVISTNY